MSIALIRCYVSGVYVFSEYLLIQLSHRCELFKYLCANIMLLSTAPEERADIDAPVCFWLCVAS